jgi:hypothetical protein
VSDTESSCRLKDAQRWRGRGAVGRWGRGGVGPWGRGALGVGAIVGERSRAQDGATASSDARQLGAGPGAGKEDLGNKNTLGFFRFPCCLLI